MEKQNVLKSGSVIAGIITAAFGLFLTIFPPQAGNTFSLVLLFLIAALIVVIGFLTASFVGAGIAALCCFIVMKIIESIPDKIGLVLIGTGALMILYSLLKERFFPSSAADEFDYHAEASADWEQYQDEECRTSVRILGMHTLNPGKFSVKGIVPGTEVGLSYEDKNRQYYFTISDHIIASVFGLSDEAVYKVRNGEAKLFVIEAGDSYLSDRDTVLNKKNILIGYYPKHNS